MRQLCPAGALGGEADFGEANEDEAEDGCWRTPTRIFLGPEAGVLAILVAASRRRVSRVPFAVSFSDGQIQCMRRVTRTISIGVMGKT